MSTDASAPMNIEGTHNFRDTGGLPLIGGGTTRERVLYRSDALQSLTPAGLQELSATAVGVVVDFRSEQERTMAPDRLPTDRPFRAVELPLLDGSMTGMPRSGLPGGAASATAQRDALAQIPSLGDLYVHMLDGGAVTFAEVARQIASSTDEEPSAVLVHCTAGKDRTGVATALMLEIAGVERDAVIADYAASQTNLAGEWAEGMLSMLDRMGVPREPQVVALVTTTPPEAMEQALGWIEEQFGDAAGYLRSGGLSDAELSAARARLRA